MFRRGFRTTKTTITEGEAGASLADRAREIFDTAP